MDAILQRDQYLAARIEQVEITLEEETNSIRFLDDESIVESRRASVIQPSSVGNDTSDPTATEIDVIALDTLPINPQDFETFLKSSRVYTRANPNEVDMISVRGSTVQTSTSSTLSRFSLNHMSIVSVFRLPITLDDITKIGSDLTFGKLISGQASPIILGQTTAPQAPDRSGVPVEHLGESEDNSYSGRIPVVKYETLKCLQENDI